MFKIESYITPIILNHVAKYVKNIRPQDAQVSLWEGEAVFQNLDLRLDVLEEELNLPFEFLSGHIHELSIHVPWTRIKWEPIRIVINTIEFVLKLKDTRAEGAGSSSANSSPQRTASSQQQQQQQQMRRSSLKSDEQQQQATQSLGSGLVNRIINNIVLECHNIILKYVEEDIVVSMNVQLLTFGSADEFWKNAMIDVHPVKVLKRTLLQISDLTICLDKRNSAGQIDVCQEPILYRCTLECRILRKYNANSVATTSTTRIGVHTRSMDMNMSSLQFPMAMRLVKLLLALKSGEIKNSPGSDKCDDDDGAAEVNANDAVESYLSWAWNLLPSFTMEPLDEEELDADEAIGHTTDMGVYIEQLNFTLKTSEFVNDSIMGGTKRIRYTPIVRVSLGGMYFERVSAEGNNWSSIKAGISSICVEPLGPYRSEEKSWDTASSSSSQALIETAAMENMNAYIDKSLFDEQHCLKAGADHGWGKTTTFEDYVARITDEYLLYRTPILAFDSVEYKKCNATSQEAAAAAPVASATAGVSAAAGTASPVAAAVNDVHVQYRLLSAGITFRYSQTFLQVKHVIDDFVRSYDYPAYHAERLETAAGTNTTGRGSSPRLPPPLMEDYDALMQHVPRCTYKFDLQRIGIEVYPKLQQSDAAALAPASATTTSRGISGGGGHKSDNLRQTVPNFLLYFDRAEGVIVTPLLPDKLVHTTCQLPDKPRELLEACFTNFQLQLYECSLSIVEQKAQRIAKLLQIPRLQLSYGQLLQSQHWRESDEIAETKVDISCDQFGVQFSKRELMDTQRLLACVLGYQPTELSRYAMRSPPHEDAIRLHNQFNKLRVRQRRYQRYVIWSGSLRGLRSDIVQSPAASRYPVLTTTSKPHNNTKKWLELYAQFPQGQADSAEQPTVIAVWVEQFRISLDRNLIDFLRYEEQPEYTRPEKQSRADTDSQSYTTPAAVPIGPPATTTLSTNTMRTNYNRKFSRSSSMPIRRVSQPEETVHLSSERDDKADVKRRKDRQAMMPNEQQHLAWLKCVKSLVVLVEVAQGTVEVVEHLHCGKNSGAAKSDHMRLLLPRLSLKSAHTELIVRNNMHQKIVLPSTEKSETVKFTIELQDCAVKLYSGETAMPLLNEVETTITIAVTHKQEKTKSRSTFVGGGVGRHVNIDTSMEARRSPKRKVPAKDADAVVVPEIKGQDQDNISVGSMVLDDRTASDVDMADLLEANEESVEKDVDVAGMGSAAGAAGRHGIQTKVRNIASLNVHADTRPIRVLLSTQKVKSLQTHLGLLLRVLESMRSVTQANGHTKAMPSVRPIQIVTATEQNAALKEFLDMETNSESSAMTDDKTEPQLTLSLFCQWTITKFIVEVESASELLASNERNMIMLEFEDLLATVDRSEDFVKYTSKVGHFALNYYEMNGKTGEWQPLEWLRVSILAGDTTHLPFLNVIVTSVGLYNFYKKIGVRRKAERDCSIDEVVVTMQAVELIVDLDRVKQFITPLCVLFEPRCGAANAETTESSFKLEESRVKKSQMKPTTVRDLPLVHLDSKGFTIYLPLQSGKQCCSVVIWKVESIKITPNLENPLQRNPVRADVYGKAVQMGILATPGSLVEDRQYELTLRNISAASGNWPEILTLMREQANNFHRTNPAFEWNHNQNQNRKAALQLTDIFNNFTFVGTYAPCIAYSNVLICGEAIEFNCASDFVASFNTSQLALVSCLVLRIKGIACIIDSSCRIQRLPRTSTDFAAFAAQTSGSTITMRSVQSLSSMERHSSVFFNARSSSTFDSIYEGSSSMSVPSAPNARTISSGYQSRLSRSHCPPLHSKERFASLSSSTSALYDTVQQARPMRQVPYTLSLVAGIFIIKFFEVQQRKDENVALKINPLLLVTISQPSFIRTQNVYDSLTQMSLFNLNVALSQEERPVSVSAAVGPKNKNLFPEILLETRPGKPNASGIPAPLLILKYHRTKMQLLEIDAEVAKPVVFKLTESYIRRLSHHVLLVYEALLENACFEVRCHRPVVRGTKIKLMRQQCFDADRLHFSCDRVVVKFLSNEYKERGRDVRPSSTDIDTGAGMYNCKLVVGDLKLNLKFLSRPEKATAKASMGMCYLHTDRKIFVHPIALRVSADFVSEPWHRLPLVVATARFNVVQVDIGISAILQLREAMQGVQRLSTYCAQRWQQFLTKRPPMGTVGQMQHDNLRRLPCPCAEFGDGASAGGGGCGSSGKGGEREEFYQDDLRNNVILISFRAGAFQFVELMSDAFLPLPYQIQIIKKNHGIICWRYPQPRKMCKIHIYPVPMAVSNPIHIKCRMEYFSEAHECFLHYSDFWLSETVSKQIQLPEREISANIWRVVILQSLVSVDGACFDNAEDDEELNAIATMKLEDVLREERAESDFILHPKVLVGCMRIDTAFQTVSVPKMQLLVSWKLLQVKMLNQPNQHGELPSLLHKFRLAEQTYISQAFIKMSVLEASCHAVFYAPNSYTLDSSLVANVVVVDFGFLNMIHLLERTHVQSYVRVDWRERRVSANVVLDKLRLNFGPSMIHTLLSSRLHWEEMLDYNKRRRRHALIPKCIVVNRTQSQLAFGQTGSTERLHLQPRECNLYCFRSDFHAQELTFFIADNERNITEASQSVPIRLKFEGNTLVQPIRIGNKCLIIKSSKLSGSQIFVLIKGQIELVSMVQHDLHVEFRQEGESYDDKAAPEYSVDQKGRCSFYRKVQRSTNIFMRLKLANMKGKGRSGDIPLRTNKNLPWLVKVPTDTPTEFISFWVRILRSDIVEIRSDQFRPQAILITIWPMFTVSSMLNCPVRIEESLTKQTYELEPQGGRCELNLPATHLTEHQVSFAFPFPLDGKSKRDYMLSLKTMDWNNFFWYDEELWTIDYALKDLAKRSRSIWPYCDAEEQRVQRHSHTAGKTSIVYTVQPSREFSCTQCLEVSPWGVFVNASSHVVSVCDYVTKERLSVDSNCVVMMFAMPSGFTLDVPNGSSWLASAPIFYDVAQDTGRSGGRCYILKNQVAGSDVAIVRDNEVLNFVLEYRRESERHVFKLRAKCAVTNFTRTKLCVLPFTMDHKETATHDKVAALDARCCKLEAKPLQSIDDCVGISVDNFYDLNARTAIRGADTAYVCFICVKVCEDSDISIPIPLAMPFTRRCLSVQNGAASMPFVVTLIEKDNVLYMNIFEDVSPALLVSNQTDARFIVAQTSAAENNKVSLVTAEFEGRHCEWYQRLEANSECYYTPPEMYRNFPDVESTMCNLTLAFYNDHPSKKNLRWSKPLRTDKMWEKFLHIPQYGDVKVRICDKHRIIRMSIFCITQKMEFSVKDLRLRLLTPSMISELDSVVVNEAPSPPLVPLSTSLLDLGKTRTAPPSTTATLCTHFSNDCPVKTQLSWRFFIKEVVLSLHTDSKDCDYMKNDILSLHVDDFLLAGDDNDDERQLNIVLTNVQVDNRLFASGKYDFPVILCAQELYVHMPLLPQVYYLERTYQELRRRPPMALLVLDFFDDEWKISSIICSFSPLRTYIEDAFVNDLLETLVECAPSNCVYVPKLRMGQVLLADGEMLLPIDVAAQAILTSEPLKLHAFRIAPLNLMLSVHTSMRMYIALDHSPLSFSTYECQHVLTVPLRFGQSLGMHYLSGAIFGAGWVVGSLEILGSPSGLARSFTTGLRDFVSMPVQGLFRGPWGFIVGVTQGSASLLRNITAGTVNSVTKLASSVARNLDRLTLDEEHIQRTDALRRLRPQGFAEGLTHGVTGFGISLLGAVGGLARHTLEARSPSEVVTGMGKGLVGALAKPISGAAELVALAGQGMLHTVGFNAMPEQRSAASGCRNLTSVPSAYRIWKLLPNVLLSDQLLFFDVVTLVVHGQMRQGYIFLTSTVLTIMEAQWDRLAFVYPVDKVEMHADRNDKTLFYVRRMTEREEIEENVSYTNQRIMNFLHTSNSFKDVTKMTTDSLNDLLQTPSLHDRKQLDWAFYINEDFGEHILQYLQIINSNIV